MVLAAFTKNWWKSSKKSDEGEEGNVDENLSTEETSEHEQSQEEANVKIEEHLHLNEVQDELKESLENDRLEDLEEEEEVYTHEGGGAPALDDPIEEAYELEEQEHQEEEPEQEERRRPSRKGIKSPKEFFNTEILYRFDIMEDDIRKKIQGTYRLELKGYQGGIWTVKVGDQLDVVNKKEDSEITYNMQQRDFMLLVNGQLNPQLAIFAGKMKINGDLQKSVSFIELLAPVE